MNFNGFICKVLTALDRDSVRRISTKNPRKPVFLHGDATFFMYLRGVLDSDLHALELKLDSMLTGSDEKAALVKAMRVAFPNAKHLFCMQTVAEEAVDNSLLDR